jgi:cytochrome c oxidase subunit III
MTTPHPHQVQRRDGPYASPYPEPGPAPEVATMAERPMRIVADVSDLPSVVFGPRNIVWWGQVGFMVVEGTTLAIILASYLYLRRNFETLPPLRTPLPDIGLPTINLVLLLLCLVPATVAGRAARQLDRARTALWMWVATALMAVVTVLRYLEFRSLNVHYDVNAYASAAWAILFTHFTLLIVDVVESAVIAAIFSLGRNEPKHFSDAADDAFYTHFMVFSWIPAYLVVYWLPRWL